MNPAPDDLLARLSEIGGEDHDMSCPSYPGCTCGHRVSYQTIVACAAARIRELEAMVAWRPIETAPRDRLVLVYAPSYQDLDAIICACSFHPDAGFCVDELRVPTHWQPLPAPPVME